MSAARQRHATARARPDGAIASDDARWMDICHFMPCARGKTPTTHLFERSLAVPLAAEPVYQVQCVRYSMVRSVRDDAVREVPEATPICSSPAHWTGIPERSWAKCNYACLLISHIAGALAPCTRSCLCGVMSYRDCLSPWCLLARENVWIELGTALMLHRCCTRFERCMVRRGGRACCE